MHISEKIKFIRTKILNVSAQKFANMCGVTPGLYMHGNLECHYLV